jgi:hypothetical protein
MSTHVNLSVMLNPFDARNHHQEIPSIEIYFLHCVTIIGIVVNLLTIVLLLMMPTYRIKSSCFLIHHCLICLILSILCFPYSLSYLNYSIRCDYLGNLQVTCVTAELLNMAAMVASEAYRFEELVHQETTSNNENISLNRFESSVDPTTKSFSSTNHLDHPHHYFQYQLKATSTSTSTISCGCLSFGILIIWFSSIILHLGSNLFF